MDMMTDPNYEGLSPTPMSETKSSGPGSSGYTPEQYTPSSGSAGSVDVFGEVAVNRYSE